jgi:hypothetical protein
VDGRLALLRAPQDVQELVAKRPDTVTVARRIATLESPGERRPLIEAVLEGTLNKEAVREIILELQTLVEGPLVAEALEPVPAFDETDPERHNHLDVRPDGQPAPVEPSEAPKRTNKSSQYSSVRRINQETSMVLSILNRWLEMEPAIWLTNQENLGRSIQAIRDTLLELVEHLAEVREVSLAEK